MRAGFSIGGEPTPLSGDLPHCLPEFGIRRPDERKSHGLASSFVVSAFLCRQSHRRPSPNVSETHPNGESLNGSRTGSRERFDQRHGSDRAAEHAEHRGTPDLIPGRQPRELMFDEVEIVMDCVKVAARLIGLAQREGVGALASAVLG